MNSERRPGGGPAGSADVLTRAARPPDLVVRYGDDPDQVADVHVPEAATHRSWTGERAPLAIFLHGGFWRAEYGREHTGPLAEALTGAGFVVCAPEYRRSGQPGGGWPGTFDDVATAADRLPRLVAKATHGLVDADPASAVLAGHSAGGHLALWAASRHRLPPGSRWRTQHHRWRGVVALAAVSDLWACYRKGLGDGAAAALIGGGPEDFADDRCAEADPSRLVPAGAQVWLLHGLDDDRVPFPMMLDYARAARAAGAPAAGATCVLLPGAGHFELIDPLSPEWPQVVDAFRRVGQHAS
ncbi:MAG: alpha/beta hydrolase family protein [Streptosporangiaceae bacterium]